MMRKPTIFACAGAMLVLIAGAAIQRSAGQTAAPNWPQLATELRPAESFAGIADTQARSVALFEEAGKVLQHPRCMNCHPAGERPRQTDLRRLHQPLVVRGKDGHGAPGMACATCHGGANFDASRVPGNPHWALAPAVDGVGRQDAGRNLRPTERSPPQRQSGHGRHPEACDER